ncbi:MAG: hypothetical protein ACJAWW_001968 [Sulfurimonas sp.]
MYKITFSLITLSIFSLSGLANSITKHINIGANNSTINSKTGNGFDISYGATRVWDSGIIGVFDMNYGQASINNTTANNYGGELKLGYDYEDIAVYGIGSGIGQSYGKTEAYGFGYGAGIEYTPFKDIGVGVDYKSYSMTSTTNEYDFETTKVYLKIIF